jgi:Xaa-Pro aminopeptidase
MKRLFLKRKFLSLFIILSFVSFVTKATPVCAHLQTEEVVYIEQITSAIKKIINETQAVLAPVTQSHMKGTDLSKNPHLKPLQHYVDELHTLLEKITKEVIEPLNDKLAQQNQKEEIYYKALKLTKEILTELHTQFSAIHTILKDPQNKNQKAVVLANKLVAKFNEITKKHRDIDAKLMQLHHYLNELKLINLMNEIAEIRKMLDHAKKAQEQTTTLAHKTAILQALQAILNKK